MNNKERRTLKNIKEDQSGEEPEPSSFGTLVRLFLPVLTILFYSSIYGQKPTIASLSSLSGPTGSTVTITGSNFDPVAANNTVFFGAVQASVNTASASELIVTVPYGTTYSPVTVLVNNLVAQSVDPFVVTFDGNEAIDANTFLSFQSEASGTGAKIIAFGDLDGDGLIDIAATNESNTSVSVYRNTSSGSGTISLSSQLLFSAHEQLNDIILADFDGDRKLDIAACNSASDTDTQSVLTILRNTSSGVGNISFDTPVDHDMGKAVSLTSLKSADLDGDGKLELAVTNASANEISIFRNLSTGPGVIDFAASIDLTTGANPFGVAIADMDGDAVPDLVIADREPNVSVFRNTSSVGSLSFESKVDFASNGTLTSHVEVGDMDGDGLADVAVSHNSAQLSVYRNTSTVGDINMAPRIDYSTLSNRTSLADINGDGKVEMINYSSSQIFIYRNSSVSGSLSFDAPLSLDVGFSSLLRSVGVGDMDNDGEPDLVAPFAGFPISAIAVFRNALSENDLLNFGFAEQTGAATIDAVNHTIAIEVANGTDVSNLVATFAASSSASDVAIGATSQSSGVTSNDFTNSVVYTVTAEDGLIQDWTVTVTEDPGFQDVDFYTELDLLDVLSNPSTLILDANVDGYNDILLTGKDASNNLKAIIYLNNGDFTYTSLDNVLSHSVLFSNAVLQKFDFNSDGVDDFIMMAKNELEVLVGDGNSVFSVVDYSDFPFEGVEEGAISLIDADLDGDEDILITGGETTSLYLKNGPSDYEKVSVSIEGFSHSTALGTQNVDLQVADLNGDLIQDVLISGTQSGSSVMKVFIGDGAGDFVELTSTGLPANSTVASVGDVDGDGDNDVTVINSSFFAEVYTNNGSGSFTSFQTLTSAYDVLSHDFDSDGDEDILGFTFDFATGAPTTRLYLYDQWSGALVESASDWIDVWSAAFAIGDLDRDFDNELILIGEGSIMSGSFFSRVYRNGINLASKDVKVEKCGTFELDGTTYTTTGLYTQTITTSEGYSRDINLDLTLWPTDSTLNVQELVNYEFNGELLTETGTYNATFPNVQGCDSLVTLNLVILTSEETLNIYTVDDYTFDGNTLTSSGRYTFTYENQYGYDSIIYVNLTIEPDTYDPQDYLQFNLVDPTFDSLYFGNPHLVDLDGDGDLDLLSSGTDNVDGTIANYHTKVYFNSGDGTFIEDTSSNLPGAASWPDGTHLVDVDGDNDPDLVMTGVGSDGATNVGTLFLNDGTGHFTEKTDANIPALHRSSMDDADVDLDGDLDLLIAGYEGQVYLLLNDGTGVYTQGSLSFKGGTYGSVNFGDVDGDNDEDVFVVGAATSNITSARLYINDGSGNFTEKLKQPFIGLTAGTSNFGDVDNDGDLDLFVMGTAFGVTGLSHADLFINDGTGNFVMDTGNDFVKHESGDSEFVDIDLDGDLDLFTNGPLIAGTRDAIIYLNNGWGHFKQMNDCLKPLTAPTTAIGDVDGDGRPDLFMSGSRGQKVVSRLYLNTVFSNELQVQTCDTYEFDGSTLSISGTYQGNFVAGNGCSYPVNLVLTVDGPTTSNTVVEACESYDWNGLTLTATGIYDTLLVSAAGCDSLAILDLTILESTSSEHDIETCDSYTWNGVEYTTSGTYDTLLTSASGCDSLVTLNLNILDQDFEEVAFDACGSYTFGSQVITASGVYEEAFTNIQGCDSTVTLAMDILPEPGNGIIQNGRVLFAEDNSAGLTYQWINCTTGEELEGETNRQLTPPLAGEYSVMVSNGVCEVTSACMTDEGEVLGVNKDVISEIYVFPNPTPGNLFVQLPDNVGRMQSVVHTIGGRLVHSRVFEGQSELQLELKDAGLYLVTINFLDQDRPSQTFKVLKR